MRTNIFVPTVIICLCIGHLAWPSLEQECREPDSADAKLNLPILFEGAKSIGKGTYGITAKVEVVLEEVKRTILIKKITIEENDTISLDLLENEISAMKAIELFKVSPTFISCSKKNAKSGKVNYYLAMDYIDGVTLQHPCFLQEVVKEGPKAMVKWMQVFRAIEYMSSLRMIHNDIKLDNLIYDFKAKKIYLIDFGTADGLGVITTQTKGTSYYLSQSKIEEKPLNVMDDVYAWILTVASAHASSLKDDEFENLGVTNEFNCYKNFQNFEGEESKEVKLLQRLYSFSNSKKKLFKQYDDKENKLVDISPSCFDMFRTPQCKAALVKNVKRVFRKAHFGEYQKPEAGNYINLTSLFADVISNDEPLLTFQFFKQQLESLLFKTQGIIINPPIELVQQLQPFTPFSSPMQPGLSYQMEWATKSKKKIEIAKESENNFNKAALNSYNADDNPDEDVHFIIKDTFQEPLDEEESDNEDRSDYEFDMDDSRVDNTSEHYESELDAFVDEKVPSKKLQKDISNANRNHQMREIRITKNKPLPKKNQFNPSVLNLELDHNLLPPIGRALPGKESHNQLPNVLKKPPRIDSRINHSNSSALDNFKLDQILSPDSKLNRDSNQKRLNVSPSLQILGQGVNSPNQKMSSGQSELRLPNSQNLLFQVGTERNSNIYAQAKKDLDLLKRESEMKSLSKKKPMRLIPLEEHRKLI